MSFSVVTPRSAQRLYATYVTSKALTSSNVASGADQGAALNAAIAAAAARGPVHLLIDSWVPLSRSIKLPSNTTLEFLAGSGLYCLPGMNAQAITNAHWVSSYNNGGTPKYAGELIVDANIAVVGRGKVVGNRGNGTTGNCTGIGTGNAPDPRISAGNAASGVPAGMWVAGVAFYGVKNLVIDGLWVEDMPTYGFMLANVFGADVRNVASINLATYSGSQPDYVYNSDGIHLVGPVDNLQVRNALISGDDDAMALNAGDGNLSGSITANSGPQAYGGYATVYTGPITNVLFDGVDLVNCLSAGRILCGAQLVDNVTFRNVKGSVYAAMFFGKFFSGIPGTGSIGSVLFDDWTVVQQNNTYGGWYFEYPSRSLEFRSVRSLIGTGKVSPQVQINSSTHKRVVVNIHQDGGGTEQPHLLVTGGTVHHARVNGARVRVGATATAVPLVSITGGTVNDLALADVSDDNGGGLVSWTGGTLAKAVVDGCRQMNTSATGVTVGTGLTLPTLAGAGNIGVTTGGAGTITDSSKFASA